MGSAQADETALEITPSRIALDDAFSRLQLLAAITTRFGPEDVTSRAAFTSSNPQVIRVDSTGFVVPVSPGRAEIAVTFEGRKAAVPVEIKAFDQDRRLDFTNEIVPLLTRYGCNGGGCHGKASGQNGFKLSLFGFDPALDYDAIVKQGRGRRVFPAAPQASLLLRKATATIPHGGGLRLTTDSEPYQMLVRWIGQGMPRGNAKAPKISQLHVEPAERILSKGSNQQLRVIAEYSDGRQQDVTRQAQFQSNNSALASVSPEGMVQTGEETGEAAIMARYIGQVAVFQAMVPQGQPLAAIEGFTPNNFIDDLAASKWKKLGIRPSPPAGDGEFLRRVTLDLCGRLPTVEEARAFLADTSSQKRSAVIDHLLDSRDYVSYTALRWSTILRNAGRGNGAVPFHRWICDQIARNVSYDEFVRGIVAVSGEPAEAPAVAWYDQLGPHNVDAITADTAEVFLGTRIQCAQCHHHPYEKWSQDDYYGLSGFFMRVTTKGGTQPTTIYSNTKVTQPLRDPRNGKIPEPRLLGGSLVNVPPERDPRQVLMDWMVQPENPFFAKAMVNRLWAHHFGKGLVDPIDDMRLTNPPSNPELLDALAKDFVEHKYDVKHMVRTMCNSAVYQLAGAPTNDNESDRQNYARFYAKRLIAEVFLDSINQVCETRTAFVGAPAKFRAVELPHNGFLSEFLDTFDRPRRVSGCECERSSGANLSQVMMLSNSQEVEDKINAKTGRIGRDLAAKKPPREIIADLYLAAFTRAPTQTELDRSLEYIQSRPDQRQALEDILWVLVNSNEFAFNH